MRKNIFLIFILIISISGCSIFNTGPNITLLKFKIDSVDDVDLGGININYKTKFSDFSANDIKNLYPVVYDEKVPLSFKLNLSANNPNLPNEDLVSPDLFIKSFPYKIFINEIEMGSGNIKKQVLAIGKGSNTNFSVDIKVDFWEIVKGNNFNNSVIPILELGGKKGLTSHIKLVVKPIITTPVGDYEYPEEIIITDSKFN